ncbi:MAG TPA: 16S rRNA (adenine(1518)-N(6)/adenine(1519)-N(6))-dimethyltransferase RsmA [Candidatus Pacearchaeota archaeon]|nr:ribosomal RNA small subunit methyltransferase A [Candidatus Parcubacteria bacterium]HOU45647.1 16S rRNA (adenine(1518)-N(6)/adenine(1519)-N(6))-dimethyltransferase RsmA [Candidatus Pacearchaeota archaeon]HPM08291.1 16S rRNA (adenine(1518)-N(6)/adenine(1519)-N(6))-dimethyltransferase RsmA [Candidatus Pacearchaeota archaeon]HQI74576.1 16S rRNA (adenine(1518)-N(6)/adenine(1519)-N(6))-dimethyltransferase RsmA [Candidatus Pacearchaeota archaeon]
MIDYTKIYSVQYIKELLNNMGASMLQSLGQNFIIQESIVDKIINESNIKKTDNIVEIGPGLGALSFKMKEKSKTLLCIEKDKKFHKMLSAAMKGNNTTVINADVLKIDLRLLPKKYKLISNLPFNIANHAIRIFLEADYKPEMTLLIQKEVAQRIIGEEGNQNLLSNSIKFYADPRIAFIVSRDNFWPAPHVDCAVIKIIPRKEQFSKDTEKKFFKILKAGFSHPRKQLLNNLSSGLKIDREKIGEKIKKIKIDPTRRAQTLSFDEWLLLTKNL